MIELADLIECLQTTPLSSWATELPASVAQKLSRNHGDLARWQQAVEELPELTVTEIELVTEFAIKGSLTTQQQSQLEHRLRQLMPWRKGPFQVFDTYIDTEWHSDWKWNRLAPHLNLQDKSVLDVGCGNGYYMWRMLGAGARYTLGIDPNLLFLCQFLAIKKYLANAPAWVLPFTLEDLPAESESFDVVFSMGVLYHRRSPIDHLLALKDCLVKGGQLVLETLVIEGDAQQVLVPQDRYAQMRNVWFLPSVAALQLWLKRVGFTDIRCVDISQTTVDEQRATSWMTFNSLADFLNPDNPTLTVEDLPAPKRAILLANK